MFSRSSLRLAHLSRQITSIPRISTTSIRNMASATTFKLNTGASVPALGFGTWQDKDAQSDAVYEALKAGYRHIDTAFVYGTEPGVAEGISRSGVPRSEIFLTTKLWCNSHHPEDVEAACDASLKALKTDYVDLYLIHWPVAFGRGSELFPKEDGKFVVDKSISYIDTWKALEKLQKTGKVRAIGVSNFSLPEMEHLLKEATVPPAVHQLELHPYLQQKEFVAFHKKHNILITAYSPFGNANQIYSKGKELPQVIETEELKAIGKKYGKSPAQVVLAWDITSGHIVIPKSKTPSRIRDNLAGDFKLDEEDLKKISTMDKKLRFGFLPDSVDHSFFDGLDGHVPNKN